jgi:hypothetical protein
MSDYLLYTVPVSYVHDISWIPLLNHAQVSELIGVNYP